MRLPAVVLGALIGILTGARSPAATEAVYHPTPARQTQARDQFGSHSLGHLLTGNNHTLDRGQWLVGTQHLAVGVADNLTIGTSPFVLANFQAFNLGARLVRNIQSDQRFGVELSYVKTFGAPTEYERYAEERCRDFGFDSSCERRNKYPEGFYTFKMEAWIAKFIYSFQPRPWYRVSLSPSYFFYVNDERPFSLRMDPQNDDPFAANLTSLHELRIRDGVFVNLEGGVWGLNYRFPYLHLGSSLSFQTSILIVTLGASATFSPSFPRERAARFVNYDSRGSVHPEIQIGAVF